MDTDRHGFLPTDFRKVLVSKVLTQRRKNAKAGNLLAGISSAGERTESRLDRIIKPGSCASVHPSSHRCSSVFIRGFFQLHGCGYFRLSLAGTWKPNLRQFL